MRRPLLAASAALLLAGAVVLCVWAYREEHSFRQRCAAAGGRFHQELRYVQLVPTGKGQSVPISHYRWTCTRGGRVLFREDT